MATVSRLPEKIRATIPIIESESGAFDCIHTLIRGLAATNDAILQNSGALALFSNISRSGLLGITVPSDQGGADVSNSVLGELVLCAASASRMTAACLASHFRAVDLLRGSANTGQNSYFYDRALAGEIFMMIGDVDSTSGFANLRAVPEIGRPGWKLNGMVELAMDAAHADWIVMRASIQTGQHALLIPRMTPGLRMSPEKVSFSNVHLDAGCIVRLADQSLSTSASLNGLLQSAQRLGWAERKLNDRVAFHARPSKQRNVFGADYLSAIGQTVCRIESGKASLERAGRLIDIAQVNINAENAEKAHFSASIALSNASEAFDLACEIDIAPLPIAWKRMDPYGHAPIGAMLLGQSLH